MQILQNFIAIDDLHSHLTEQGLAEHERTEILEILEDALFHKFLDVILTDLSLDDRVYVLDTLASGDHVTVVEFVRTKKPGIEEVITSELEGLKQELLDELSYK